MLNEEELKQMGLGGGSSGKQEAEEWEAELEKELQVFQVYKSVVASSKMCILHLSCVFTL